jgi:hypothetical protein
LRAFIIVPQTAKWSRYKASNRVMDFCDRIETAVREIRIAPKRPDVVFADEAQDLNPMQLSLVRRWGGNAQYFIIAADDDQTIYCWCGATPDAVLDPEIPEDHKIILKESHRAGAPPVPDDVRQNYQEKVLALLQLPFQRDANDEPCAHLLTLEVAAQKRLRDFEAWIEPQLSEFGDLGRMTDWGGKLVGAVGRIAALLHMAEFAGTDAPWSEMISLAAVEAAIRIGKYLIPHAKAAFAEMGADEAVENAKIILRWVSHTQLDCFTRRDLHQALRATFRKAVDLDAPLALLASHDFIRLRPDGSDDGPGRPPSPTYDVNPMWVSRNFEYCEDSEGGSGLKQRDSLQAHGSIGLD